MKNIFFAFMIFCLSFSAIAVEVEKESAYDRVMRTGIIRCGYIVYEPYLQKDANTGAFSGIFYDLMEAIGKNAGFQIEWNEETGYETIFTGLDSGRYDVFCGGLWPNTARAKAALFTIPAFYSTITAWGRPGETRFQDLSRVNEADVRIATIDGAQEDIIATTDFPKAERVSSPALSPFTDNFQKIVSKKADITFVEPSLVKAYVAAHPGSLEQISPEPLRIFGNTLVVEKRDYQLKLFLDAAFQELIYSGHIDRILKKHEKFPGSFLPAAKPYEVPK